MSRPSIDNIRVSIRMRPMNEKEAAAAEQYHAWNVKNRSHIYQVDSLGRALNGTNGYMFDKIFECESNDEVYSCIAKEIIHSSMEGINGTIFAYGQTSSGKTFTIHGNEKNPGIIVAAVNDVFDHINNTLDREFLLRVSYLEIYNEVIKDLLHPENHNLKIHENPNREIYVGNLSEEIVLSPTDVKALLTRGEGNRHVGGTNMNEHSSRSHTIFKMIIESREKCPKDARHSYSGAVKVSQINLVDLAGSERASHTGAEGIRLKEGGHINKSLLALGTVIAKLSEGNDAHIPYRDSKLTRILQPSLGGNAKTAIICTITPSSAYIEETQSTLKFASRARAIANSPAINEVITDEALLKRYKREISDLKRKLEDLNSINLKEQLQEMATERMKILAENEINKQTIEQVERDRFELKEKIKRMANLILNDSTNSDGLSGGNSKSRRSKRRKTWFPGLMAVEDMSECIENEEPNKSFNRESLLPNEEFPVVPADNLKKQLEQYRSKINFLTAELSIYKQECEEYSKAYEAECKCLKSAQMQLDESLKLTQSLQGKLAKAEENALDEIRAKDEISQKLAELNEKVFGFQQQLEVGENLVLTLKQHLNSVLDNQQMIRKQQDNYFDKLTLLQINIEQLKLSGFEEVSQMKHTFSYLEKDCERLKNASRRLVDRVKLIYNTFSEQNLKEKLVILKEQIEHKNKLFSEEKHKLLSENTLLRSDISVLENTLKQSNDAVNQLTQQKAEIELHLKDLVEQFDVVNDELCKSNNENKSLAQKVTDLDKIRSNLQNELSARDQKLKSLESSLNEKINENAELLSQNKFYEESINELNGQMSNKNREFSTLKEDNLMLITKIEEETSAKIKLCEQIGSLTKQLEARNDILNDLNSDNEKLQEDFNRKCLHNVELEKEVELFRLKDTELSTEVARLRCEVEQLRGLLSEEKSKNVLGDPYEIVKHQRSHANRPSVNFTTNLPAAKSHETRSMRSFKMNKSKNSQEECNQQ